jgi:hypothetical protein
MLVIPAPAYSLAQAAWVPRIKVSHACVRQFAHSQHGVEEQIARQRFSDWALDVEES